MPAINVKAGGEAYGGGAPEAPGGGGGGPGLYDSVLARGTGNESWKDGSIQADCSQGSSGQLHPRRAENLWTLRTGDTHGGGAAAAPSAAGGGGGGQAFKNTSQSTSSLFNDGGSGRLLRLSNDNGTLGLLGILPKAPLPIRYQRAW